MFSQSITNKNGKKSYKKVVGNLRKDWKIDYLISDGMVMMIINDDDMLCFLFLHFIVQHKIRKNESFCN
jgi:ATP-dependent protease HslVU (ClpYQ) peptidase subunit